MLGEKLREHVALQPVGRRDPKLRSRLGDRVLAARFGRQRNADLGAARGRDPSLAVEVLPRRVVSLRSDQRENVVLAAVLADERRGETEASTRLELRGG